MQEFELLFESTARGYLSSQLDILIGDSVDVEFGWCSIDSSIIRAIILSNPR